MNLTTTLGEILKHGPCGLRPGSGEGWDKLTTNLGTTDKNAKVNILQILDSNGVRDAYWVLRCWDHIEYCLLLADVAEAVLHIFEERYPDDKRPRKAIDGIRAFKRGEITLEERRSLAAAAAAAANSAAANSAAAAFAAAYYADADAAAAAAAFAADAAADAQWAKNEQLMRDWIEK